MLCGVLEQGCIGLPDRREGSAIEHQRAELRTRQRNTGSKVPHTNGVRVLGT